MDDDIDYGELFGVSPEGGGAEPDKEPEERDAEPAGAVPAPDGKAESGGGAELDTPEPGTSQQDGEHPQQPAGGTAPGEQLSASPSAQTTPPAQDEAAMARAKAEAQRIIDETFARSGLRNPYTGQPITSKAEYDAYLERFSAEQTDQVLQKTGMSREQFQQFVQNLPEVRKARETQAAAEQTVREAREAAAKVKVDEQLREIGTLAPGIKSLEDLTKMPTYPRFYELVKRGNTLTDAFKLANFDALAQRSAAGARQAAVNAARSKEHLEQTRTRGKGAASVPAEVREQYKLFNPDATDEEIQKHYQRSHKEG